MAFLNVQSSIDERRTLVVLTKVSNRSAFGLVRYQLNVYEQCHMERLKASNTVVFNGKIIIQNGERALQ